MRTALALTGLLFLVSACSDPEPAEPTPSASPSPQTEVPAEPPAETPRPVATLHEYSCADGLMFEVVIDDQEATLQVRDQRFDLHRQPSASGALYTDEHWSLFTKGERAILSAEDLTHDCDVRASRPVSAPGQVPDVTTSGEG
ncbi:MAG: MliC family protein [Alcanivoracaceae bacterium]